ncbi:hypothetical protein MMC06_001876 [Schaereria dolodes]|nr:hypothetical protein [Schaereria dolodes]
MADDLTSSQDGEGRSHPLSDLYNMCVLVEPPSTVRPGEVINPIVLRVDKRDNQRHDPQDSSHPAVLWALLSVLSEDGITSLAPPAQSEFVRGRMVSSIYPLSPDDLAQGAGYIVFANTAILQPGRYLLRVSLMGMQVDIDSREGEPLFLGGVNLQSTALGVVHVYPRAGSPSLDPGTEHVLDILRNRGLQIL